MHVCPGGTCVCMSRSVHVYPGGKCVYVSRSVHVYPGEKCVYMSRSVHVYPGGKCVYVPKSVQVCPGGSVSTRVSGRDMCTCGCTLSGTVASGDLIARIRQTGSKWARVCPVCSESGICRGAGEAPSSHRHLLWAEEHGHGPSASQSLRDSPSSTFFPLSWKEREGYHDSPNSQGGTVSARAGAKGGSEVGLAGPPWHVKTAASGRPTGCGVASTISGASGGPLSAL